MISSFFSSIRWQDIVDIVLNSYILFRLYILFRGTNAFRVITGIAILWFIQRVAFFLGLIITSWVMQGITAVAALIIIIVFRNEIRSVLQAKNFKSILWGFSLKADNTPVGILADSIFELARRECGALIVLPGKEDLRGFVTGGIPLHGVISQEMIISIFWPDNPVHDGAAVIQGDQISKVGVILPLSHRDNLPSFYGTRHRAAVGLAEATDALTIVVSEERGDVSVAKASKIRGIKTKIKLINILEKHLGISEKDTKYPVKKKLEIAVAALASFLFITGIWFAFSQGMDTLTTLEVPVEYMKRDPGMEILETSVDTVNLQLSGSGALIKSIRPGQIRVKLDLSKALVGRNTFTITNENIILPPGIFIKKVQPSVVDVALDTRVEKKLPIQVDWIGKMPDQLTIESVKLDPDKVRVIGGKRILDNISTIYTEKVPLDNMNESGTAIVNLALSPASLKIASNSKSKIALRYLVKKNHR